MDIFYVFPEDCSSQTVILRGDEFHHLTRVMRKRVGEELMVTDGKGNLFRTTIARIEHNQAHADIIEVHKNYNESSLRVTLAIGILKNPSRLDDAIEKCTEVGVAAYIPFQSARVIPHSIKVDRWNKIILSAMKQSCRTILPSLSKLQSFEAMLASSYHFEVKLIAHEAVDRSTTIDTIISGKSNASSAIICIGPEGGFTEDELHMAQAAGFIPVSLGQRRLRSETAAVVAASMLLSISR